MDQRFLLPSGHRRYGRVLRPYDHVWLWRGFHTRVKGLACYFNPFHSHISSLKGYVSLLNSSSVPQICKAKTMLEWQQKQHTNYFGTYFLKDTSAKQLTLLKTVQKFSNPNYIKIKLRTSQFLSITLSSLLQVKTYDKNSRYIRERKNVIWQKSHHSIPV